MMRRALEILLVLSSLALAAPSEGASAAPASPSYCPAPAWKQPDPQGPVVYTDPHGKAYTKNQMDSLYDQVCWQQDAPATVPRNEWLTSRFIAQFGAPARFSYGPSEYEGLDLYRTLANSADAPTMIFIHGGAWRSGLASNYGYMAENFVQAGANFVVLDFINVVQAKGNLMTMAEQVRAGVAWVYQNAKTLKINPARIYVSGHSSGGHLCGVVVTTDWAARGLPADFIKGAVCASGLFDLQPVSLSARNLYVNFDAATIKELSPAQHIANLRAPLVLGHGTKETPEFQRQSDDFAATLKAVGKQVSLIVAPGYNHFEFAETFANPYGPLGRASLQMMGLQPGAALAAGRQASAGKPDQ